MRLVMCTFVVLAFATGLVFFLCGCNNAPLTPEAANPPATWQRLDGESMAQPATWILTLEDGQRFLIVYADAEVIKLDRPITKMTQ